jgi:UDP-N-acetylglucosamine 4,6-dehydratase/5-epimerase
MMFFNERVLITGGAGSLGRELARQLCQDNEVVIYSRNEERQFDMQQLATGWNGTLRYVIGDVRDENTLTDAMRSCTIAIHAAAMKDLIMCEDQPTQTYLNNLVATTSFLQAVKRTPSIKRACGVSTDKAASPSSVYGCTKYIMEQMFREAARHSDCIMSAVRFGNMIDSKGSLISEWRRNPSKELCLTHPDVARFFFTVKDGANTVVSALDRANNGEILIRKMKQARIYDVLRLITGRTEFKIIGLFPGEKIHEELVSAAESPYCHDEGEYFAIRPGVLNKNTQCSYSTSNAPAFTDIELRNLIGV